MFVNTLILALNFRSLKLIRIYLFQVLKTHNILRFFLFFKHSIFSQNSNFAGTCYMEFKITLIKRTIYDFTIRIFANIAYTCATSFFFESLFQLLSVAKQYIRTTYMGHNSFFIYFVNFHNTLQIRAILTFYKIFFKNLKFLIIFWN